MSNYTNRTDGELLAEFSAQRVEAPFEELFRRHGRMVFNVCHRVLRAHPDAEDAAQAVFLTLANKAASLRGRASLASWLHQVGWHVALRAREAAALRRNREREAGGMSERGARDPAAVDNAWEDLRPHLDAELEALPEKYRLPLIVHHLEGWSEEEGAQRLGWSRGTFSSRISRGRELLRERLARRGAVFSVGLLTKQISEHTAGVEVPASLASVTVKAASLLAAGNTAAGGLVSAHATLLTKGALKMLFLAKMKVAALLFLAVSVLGGGLGVAVYQVRAEETPRAHEKEPPKPTADEAGVARASGLPKEIRGPKILVAFDVWGSAGGAEEIKRRTAEIETALKMARVEVLQQVGIDLFLTDAGGQQPAVALKDLPYRQGAMVFQDGSYREAIPFVSSYDKKAWIPAPYASLHWGSVSGDTEQTARDIERISALPGIVAKKVNTMPGQKVYGNPWILKLTPTEGKTLLEVFLLAKAEFHYVEFKPAAKSLTPAVKDGLSVTAAPVKAVFSPDERIGFELKYHNKTKALVVLCDPGVKHLADSSYFERRAEILIARKDDGARWKVVFTAEATLASPNGEFVEVPPGTIHTERFELSRFKSYRPIDAQGKGTGPSVGSLPSPGRYVMAAQLKFPATGGNLRQNPWVGELTANPAEFEIAGQAPPAALTPERAADLAREIAWKRWKEKYKDWNEKDGHPKCLKSSPKVTKEAHGWRVLFDDVRGRPAGDSRVTVTLDEDGKETGKTECRWDAE